MATCVQYLVLLYGGHCFQRGNNYNLMYYVIILNLSFASLHKKKVLFPFAWSHLLLSVPFEGIFRDNLAIDLRCFLESAFSVYV